MAESNEKVFSNTVINWLVTFFATLSRNAYKIRICED